MRRSCAYYRGVRGALPSRAGPLRHGRGGALTDALPHYLDWQQRGVPQTVPLAAVRVRADCTCAHSPTSLPFHLPSCCTRDSIWGDSGTASPHLVANVLGGCAGAAAFSFRAGNAIKPCRCCLARLFQHARRTPALRTWLRARKAPRSCWAGHFLWRQAAAPRLPSPGTLSLILHLMRHFALAGDLRHSPSSVNAKRRFAVHGDSRRLFYGVRRCVGACDAAAPCARYNANCRGRKRKALRCRCAALRAAWQRLFSRSWRLTLPAACAARRCRAAAIPCLLFCLTLYRYFYRRHSFVQRCLFLRMRFMPAMALFDATYTARGGRAGLSRRRNIAGHSGGAEDGGAAGRALEPLKLSAPLCSRGGEAFCHLLRGVASLWASVRTISVAPVYACYNRACAKQRTYASSLLWRTVGATFVPRRRGAGWYDDGSGVTGRSSGRAALSGTCTRDPGALACGLATSAQTLDLIAWYGLARQLLAAAAMHCGAAGERSSGRAASRIAQ